MQAVPPKAQEPALLAMNAQAKGLTHALQKAFPNWREAAFNAVHRRSKPASPGESLR
ncbi:hypothetical protein MIZ03_2856 [Rhodoferax lithotrophicus]|uniref:Uncharacterized protein n=1 Tax=Rhodoferax lithotrophicus TaxID=2798804 RepID=A0ABM7MNS1_9BURK|nr:hypothetical protein MIZ03_2856 [Rhodoferax sp. MIZ03]